MAHQVVRAANGDLDGVVEQIRRNGPHLAGPRGCVEECLTLLRNVLHNLLGMDGQALEIRPRF